jgi:hypothetical protein
MCEEACIEVAIDCIETGLGTLVVFVQDRTGCFQSIGRQYLVSRSFDAGWDLEASIKNLLVSE